MEKFQLTKEGVAKLEAEYRHLLDVERPAITKELVEARALGDLSENADYDAAREGQARIESRIKEIEAILSNYELIKEKGSTKTVQVGSCVTIKMLDFDEEEKYEIVGVIEANPLENKISNEAPLAKAILGHKIGEVVEVEVAKPYKVEIVAIEKN
jgi:transcription elongation factor GreA